MTDRSYLRMVAVIFTTSIVAKLASIIIEPNRVLVAHQLFSFLSLQQFLFFSAAFEMIVLWGVLSEAISIRWKAHFIYGLSIFFTCYHVWLKSNGTSGCGCFGIFPSRALNQALDFVTCGTLLVLLVSSVLVTIHEVVREEARSQQS